MLPNNMFFPNSLVNAKMVYLSCSSSRIVMGLFNMYFLGMPIRVPAIFWGQH